MASKASRAERKAARYWVPVVGKNVPRKGPQGGDEGDSRSEEHAQSAASPPDAKARGCNSMRTTSSQSVSFDCSNDDEMGEPCTGHSEEGITRRMKGNIPTSHEATLADRDAITYRNSKESVLLQLPAEIRRQIWEMAFGYRTVHPRAMRGKMNWQAQRMRLQASKWGVSYDPCLEKLSNYELYDLSLQDPEADRWPDGMYPELGSPGWHDCGSQENPRRHHYLVPPVCKQLWTEASESAWETVTFAFTTSGDFQHFARFSGARLDKIRQICLISPGMDFFGGHEMSEKSKFERGWERVLRSGVLDEFTSLVGLDLILRSFWGTSRWGTSTVERLEFPPDECLYLPEIIQVFRQIRLRPERVTVLVTNDRADEPYGYEDFTVPKRRFMAQTIRNFILEENPIRDWTGPGQMMMNWS
ncbi:hypothetical protein PMIN02_004179 [Paraphaeosphaeria minitans]